MLVFSDCAILSPKDELIFHIAEALDKDEEELAS
jgi:hypothetical protein